MASGVNDQSPEVMVLHCRFLCSVMTVHLHGCHIIKTQGG